MKYLGSLLVFCLFILFSNNSSANYALGGSVEYHWLKDSTYRVYFKHIRPCTSGQPIPPSTFDLCIYNYCTNTKSTVQMQKVTGLIMDNSFENGYIIPITCDTNQNDCYTLNGAVAGMREWWYFVDVTLPSRCVRWKFSVSFSHRSNQDNVSNQNYYSEANLYTNNLNSPQTNTSPYFLSSGVISACYGQQTIYNGGAIDIDGDSLVYSVVKPQSTIFQTCIDTSSDVIFKTQTPPLQIPTNPFRCNNSFTINSQTGTISFTHSTGSTGGIGSLLTILVEEYRNGVLIGSLIRDMHIRPTTCNVQPASFTPDMTSISGATFSSGRLSGCIGKMMSFCYDITSTNPSAKFIASDKRQVSVPGSQMLYYNQKSDSVRGCFGWEPKPNDVGVKTIIVEVLDSTCSNGLLYNRQVLFEVEVAPPVKTDNDMVVCVNEPVQLSATGGWGTYSWQVLSGTPNSLSCTNCASPVATPGVKTTYRVSSTNGVCGGDKYYADTITIDVHNATPTNPTISISAAPSAVVQPGTSVTFTANTTACNNPEYLWLKNGKALGTATTSTWTSQLLNDQDRISCQLTCADTCPKPRIQESNIITMQINNSVASVAQAPTTKIYPNPNNGAFTIETDLDITEQVTTIQVVNTFGQVVYKDTLNNNQQQVNLQQLSTGVYFLKLVSQEATSTTQFAIR